MARHTTVKRWPSGLDKWTLRAGYYDEWEFQIGNSARHRDGERGEKEKEEKNRQKKKRKKFPLKVLPMANWKLMPTGLVDIHSIGSYWIAGLALS